MSHHFIVSLWHEGAAFMSSAHPAEHRPLYRLGLVPEIFLLSTPIFTSLSPFPSNLLHLFPPTLGKKQAHTEKSMLKNFSFLSVGEYNFLNQISNRNTCACKFQFALPASTPRTPANEFPRIPIKKQQQRAIMMVKSNLFKMEKETIHKTFLHYCPDTLCLYLQPLIFTGPLTP